MMKVLITGTSGQVGSALAQLLRKNYEVFAPHRAQCDISDPVMLSKVLDEFKPELVVNPAAYTAVDRAEDNVDLAFRVNAGGPATLAAWAAEHRVPLIHFSTDYVFDGEGTAPWREDSTAKPLSVYGASKLAGEEAIQKAGGSYLIVRTSWVYAASGANFLRTIARLARERKELQIVADQVGSPTSARTIADVIEQLLQKNKANLAGSFADAGGFVHIACAGETSWHGFAEAIVEGLKSRGVALDVKVIAPIKTRDYTAKASRPINSRLDLSRLRTKFGIVTPFWVDALAVELDQLAAEMS
jgi:dTDP-4-dehydrorhamnose reductase